MILNEIIRVKKQQLKVEKILVSPQSMKEQARMHQRHPLDFKKAFEGEPIAIIAEIKKASPSKGIFKESFNPIEIAKTYKKVGVQAISILTESEFFQGDKKYLEAIRQVVDVPLLRKDFIIDEYQIDESYLLGADAVLLIVACLDKDKLEKFISHVRAYEMQAIVEVHDEEELKQALEAGADLIGINNRDLNTFKTSIETTKRIASAIPKDKIVVSESGIHTYEDICVVKEAGASAVLIGEVFMKSTHIEATLEELKHGIKG